MKDCREAQFLEGQKRRNDNLAKTRRNTEVLDAFWKALRKYLQKWDSDLDALRVSTTVTAKQRREISDEFNRLEVTLKSLQCDSLAFDQVELPISDIRLLHKEFTMRATRLNQDREELCPSTKFVFQRYRAAMKEQNSQIMVEETPKLTHATIRPMILTNRNAIHDLHDVAIVEESNGRVRIQSDSGKVSVCDTTNEKSSSSIILQNLRNCRVQMYVSKTAYLRLTNNTQTYPCASYHHTFLRRSRPYKAIHLLNITHCHVVVSQGVEGAIHVSSCGHLELVASCHQLRLHESQYLKCHVKVGSGPILEGCSNILFFASSKTDLVRDTKDFNWLRNGVPSPNYSIVDAMISLSRTDLLGLPFEQCETSSPTGKIALAGSFHSVEGVGDPTQDTDDEL